MRMGPEHPNYEENYQTFCIYCQHDYGTFNKLKRHLRSKHRGTYAQMNLAPDDGK